MRTPHSLTANYQGTTKADGKTVHRFTAHSGGMTRTRRQLNPDGWSLINFHNNPIILFNHDHNQPVGTGLVSLEPPALMVDIKFSAFARGPEIESLVEEGTIRMLSVGWRTPTENIHLIRQGNKPVGIRFDSQDLEEISVVAVGDDPGALKTASADEALQPYLTALSVVEEFTRNLKEIRN